jgi:DNA-binding IclR family transcriptional regulator
VCIVLIRLSATIGLNTYTINIALVTLTENRLIAPEPIDIELRKTRPKAYSMSWEQQLQGVFSVAIENSANAANAANAIRTLSAR